jgi:hypothetical protein
MNGALYVSGRTFGLGGEPGMRGNAGVCVGRGNGVTGVGATGARGGTVTGRTAGFLSIGFIWCSSSLQQLHKLGWRHVAQSAS